MNALDLILQKLPCLVDYLCFGAVCKRWLSAAEEQKEKRKISSTKKGVPHVLVFTGKELPFRWIFCGSSHRYVATVDENLVIALVNPFSDHAIELPPIREQEIFPAPGFFDNVVKKKPFWFDYMVKKVVLSDDPALFPDDYEVVVIFGLLRSIAFLKSGDKAWTYLINALQLHPVKPIGLTLFTDVVYYKGKILAVENSGGLFQFEFSREEGDPPETKQLRYEVIVEPGFSILPNFSGLCMAYLVESSGGDLLRVQRILDGDDEENENDKRPMTVDFRVWKLKDWSPNDENDEATAMWVEIDGMALVMICCTWETVIRSVSRVWTIRDARSVLRIQDARGTAYISLMI